MRSIRKISRRLTGVLLVVICALLHTRLAAQTPAGVWQGNITRDGRSWRTSVEIIRSDTGATALVEFPDVGRYGLPFTVTASDTSLRLERIVPGRAPVIFDGRLHGGIYRGDWSGMGTSGAFELRPMMKRPYARFREEEVSFANGDISLSGTLLLPEGTGPFPVVVFVHGSGAEDRYVWRAARGVPNARNGIAALVYDKRGVGKSTGEWRTASLHDLAGDALAGIRMLKTRRDIDTTRIGIEGYSQGGWIAPLAASMTDDISFIVVGAASAITAAEQSVFHTSNMLREAGFSEEVIDTAARLRTRVYETARTGEPRTELMRDLRAVSDRPWFETSLLPDSLEDRVHPGVVSMLFHDPIPIWERTRVPVLATWGDRDINVPVERGMKLIGDALRKAGNDDVTIRVFPNADHGMLIVNPPDTWDFPRIAPGYDDLLIDWVKKVTSRKKSG